MRLAIPISILVAFLFCGVQTYRNYVQIGMMTPPAYPDPRAGGSLEGSGLRTTMGEVEPLVGDFTIVKRTEEFPDQLKAAFAKETNEPFALANPGEEFQVTDVIRNPKLPRRRLIFAGFGKSSWFVHYEQGGIGRFYGVIIFELDSGSKVRQVHQLHGLSAAQDLRGLRKAIAVSGFE